MAVRLPERLPGRTPAEQVYRVWLGYQRRPKICKLTEARRKLLNRALVDHEERDIAALVVYAYEADEPGPRFWRGENRSGRTYLDLTNLLSDAKRLPGRVEQAVDWYDRVSSAPVVSDAIEAGDPTALLMALATRAPGSVPAAATTRSVTRPAVRRTMRPRWGDDGVD